MTKADFNAYYQLNALESRYDDIINKSIPSPSQNSASLSAGEIEFQLRLDIKSLYMKAKTKIAQAKEQL